MIKVSDGVFELSTNNTTYAFVAGENGELLHLYYGKKIDLTEGAVNALKQKWSNQNGCSIVWDPEKNLRCPDDEKTEVSAFGYGDTKEPLIKIRFADGSSASSFRFVKHEISDIKDVQYSYEAGSLPHSWDKDGGKEKALTLTLKEEATEVQIKLTYCVYEEADCITRSVTVYNSSGKDIVMEKCYSLQLDMDADAVKVSSFHGDWGREMDKCDVMLTGGAFVSGSAGGYDDQ